MPVNLNAFLRYKTIDQLLVGGRCCTFEEIQMACSDALYETCGKDDLVSERTIRGDLEIMRSGKLGIEAPIKVKDGMYYYDDQSFTIWLGLIPIDDPKIRGLFLEMLQEEADKEEYNQKVHYMKLYEMEESPESPSQKDSGDDHELPFLEKSDSITKLLVEHHAQRYRHIPEEPMLNLPLTLTEIEEHFPVEHLYLREMVRTRLYDYESEQR